MTSFSHRELKEPVSVVVNPVTRNWVVADIGARAVLVFEPSGKLVGMSFACVKQLHHCDQGWPHWRPRRARRAAFSGSWSCGRGPGRWFQDPGLLRGRGHGEQCSGFEEFRWIHPNMMSWTSDEWDRTSRLTWGWPWSPWLSWRTNLNAGQAGQVQRIRRRALVKEGNISGGGDSLWIRVDFSSLWELTGLRRICSLVSYDPVSVKMFWETCSGREATCKCGTTRKVVFSPLWTGLDMIKSLIKMTRSRTLVFTIIYGSHGTRLRRPCGLAVSAEGRHAYLVDMARCLFSESHGNGGDPWRSLQHGDTQGLSSATVSGSSDTNEEAARFLSSFNFFKLLLEPT